MKILMLLLLVGLVACKPQTNEDTRKNNSQEYELIDSQVLALEGTRVWVSATGLSVAAIQLGATPQEKKHITCHDGDIELSTLSVENGIYQQFLELNQCNYLNGIEVDGHLNLLLQATSNSYQYTVYGYLAVSANGKTIQLENIHQTIDVNEITGLSIGSLTYNLSSSVLNETFAVDTSQPILYPTNLDFLPKNGVQTLTSPTTRIETIFTGEDGGVQVLSPQGSWVFNWNDLLY